MRVELESAFNELQRNELTVFLDYEKHDPIGYNTGTHETEPMSGS